MRSYDSLDTKKSATTEFNLNSNMSNNIDAPIPNIIQRRTSSSLKIDEAVATQPSYSRLKVDLNFPTNIANTKNVFMENDIGYCVRKRNVTFATSTQEKQQQTSPQSVSTTSSTHTSQCGENSSVSSISPCISPTKAVRIDDSVQEFYDDLINRTSDQKNETNSSLLPINIVPGNASFVRRAVGDDDGFESLNGKSSSGEDTNASPDATARLRSANSQERVEQLIDVSINYLQFIPIFTKIILCYLAKTKNA